MTSILDSPTDWDTVEKNLRMLDETPDNIQTSLATAIQIFNVKHLPDFMKWKVESKFKKLNLGTVPRYPKWVVVL